jgi:protein-S-isoprenylcysteine O-methyltransferase Ste14
MSEQWIISLGLALLLALAAVIARRLGAEYRTRLRPSLLTVVAVWVFYAIHFALVVIAAVQSTWRFSLPAPVALGGGIALITVGGTVYLCAAYVFGFKRQSGLDTTRLVTDGIYRWSRNPLFVGWTLVLVGVGVVRGSAMVLVLTLLFWATYRICLPLEEELLGRLYGETYEKYRLRTHKYFGPPRRADKTAPNGMQPAAFGGG